MNVLVDLLWGVLSFAFFATVVACAGIGGVVLLATVAERGPLGTAAEGAFLMILAFGLAWVVYDARWSEPR